MVGPPGLEPSNLGLSGDESDGLGKIVTPLACAVPCRTVVNSCCFLRDRLSAVLRNERAPDSRLQITERQVGTASS